MLRQYMRPLLLDYMDELIAQKHVDEVLAKLGLSFTIEELGECVGAAAQYACQGNYQRQCWASWEPGKMHNGPAYRGEYYEHEHEVLAAIERCKAELQSWTKRRAVAEHFAKCDGWEVLYIAKSYKLSDVEYFTTAYAIGETEAELFRSPGTSQAAAELSKLAKC